MHSRNEPYSIIEISKSSKQLRNDLAVTFQDLNILNKKIMSKNILDVR